MTWTEWVIWANNLRREELEKQRLMHLEMTKLIGGKDVTKEDGKGTKSTG